MIGASGAIAAVMGAYLVWFPDAPVRSLVIVVLVPIVVRIRAKWVLSFWFLLQFLTSPNSGVAWAAHVGGFVFGVWSGLLVRASPTGCAAWLMVRGSTGRGPVGSHGRSRLPAGIDDRAADRPTAARSGATRSGAGVGAVGRRRSTR